jgi:hypothetical protein
MACVKEVASAVQHDLLFIIRIHLVTFYEDDLVPFLMMSSTLMTFKFYSKIRVILDVCFEVLAKNNAILM